MESASTGGLPKVFEDDHKGEKTLKSVHERKLQELYAEIGRLNTQLTWLKKKSGIDIIEK
jgi:putative transposase